MEWKRCSGSGQLAVPSESFSSRRDFRPMCPVCTKYVKVEVGQLVPPHDSVVIQSTPIEYPTQPGSRQ